MRYLLGLNGKGAVGVFGNGAVDGAAVADGDAVDDAGAGDIPHRAVGQNDVDLADAVVGGGVEDPAGGQIVVGVFGGVTLTVEVYQVDR